MVTTAPFRAIKACRLCGGDHLVPVIDLGWQALTGRFPSVGQPDAQSAPLTVVRCTVCGLVQLEHSVDAGEMYNEGYGYRSGINATMRQHLAGIAAQAGTRAGLRPSNAVLDIGCNDGTLLGAYGVAGLHRYGIDPTAAMFMDGYSPDMRIHAGFFDAAAYARLSGGQPARVVTSISMVYDLEEPNRFFGDVAAVLAADGVWVLEQSYLPSMLERNSFDTICHEHLEYYAFAQIDRMARSHGLRVFDVSLNETNGGSFQLWVCHDAAPYRTEETAVRDFKARENTLALDTDQPYEAFRSRVSTIGEQLRTLIMAERERGKRVFVYGASTKGNVLLQHFGLDHTLIEACADRNLEKWTRRTPGTAIPIISEEEARERADYFLVLPWHFREEFLVRESDFRRRGGKFIFPLPTVEVC